MKTDESIKLFGMSAQMVERELDSIEATHKLDLQRGVETDDADEDYYPQFDEKVRREASAMAAHYEMFYCLEQSIRELVGSKLADQHGESWWATAVPQTVRENVRVNMQRERDSAVTQRSEREIDYTTFGELGDIVRQNWQTFSDTFNTEKAFTRVMNNLNVLRGPIAHCSPLAPDEVVRLRLTVRDWFRLME
ncbi:MAG: Swt1 family HEPN domain-containing protein [Verrucomicrobiota bacterium]